MFRGIPGKNMYGRRYPWKEWFTYKEFTLVQGEDYNGRAYTMAQQVRNAAASKKYNLDVSISISEDEKSITVTVHGPKK